MDPPMVVYFIFGDIAVVVGLGVCVSLLRIARVVLPRYCNICKLSMLTLGLQCCSAARWRDLVVAP